MKKFGLALGVFLTLATQQAFADDNNVTLVARDGSVTLQGNLIWQDHEKICIETALGEFIFQKRDMACVGDACQMAQEKS